MKWEVSTTYFASDPQSMGHGHNVAINTYTMKIEAHICLSTLSAPRSRTTNPTLHNERRFVSST